MKIILMVLFLSPQMLLARTIFEPNLSLNAGSSEGPIAGFGDIQANYTSLHGGVRYGITSEYVHVTAVAEAYYLDLSSDQIEMDSQFKTNFGIALGYEWNIPVRTYVTIGFPFSSAEVSYYYSENMIIGLRYTQLKIEINNDTLDASTIGVAVSFPIEFDYPSYWWRKKDWQ